MSINWWDRKVWLHLTKQMTNELVVMAIRWWLQARVDIWVNINGPWWWCALLVWIFDYLLKWRKETLFSSENVSVFWIQVSYTLGCMLLYVCLGVSLPHSPTTAAEQLTALCSVVCLLLWISYIQSFQCCQKIISHNSFPAVSLYRCKNVACVMFLNDWLCLKSQVDQARMSSLWFFFQHSS